MDFTRQTALFNPEKNKYGITIFGTGSIGSWLAYGLAKTGITDIKVIDMDTVEEPNIPAQCFGIQDIGKNKTEAIQERILKDTGINIKIENAKVNKDYQILPEPNMIYFCAFDNLIGSDELHGRKTLFDRLKKYPVIWAEARIGRFDMRYYFVNTRDEPWVKEYEETFTNGGNDELHCGEKCLHAVNTHLVSEIIMNIMRIATDSPYNTLYARNLKSYDTLERLPKSP